MAQLTFVLPFTFRETITEDLPWRQNVNSGAALRLTVLLHTFVRKFAQNDLSAFLIICPTDECERLELLLRSITRDRRYQVIPEQNWLQPLPLTTSPHKPVAGWYIQQLIKMAASSYVNTPFYVTLDCDIVCMRSFDAGELVYSRPESEKHLVSVETAEDYTRLYQNSYADHEMKTKNRRYLQSAHILRYERGEQYREKFYGETPCVISTDKMNKLREYLVSLSRSSWQNLLIATPGWTEYSLYFQYLEMTDTLEKTTCRSSCNSVLDIERSVWHHACWYRAERRYDKDHFVSGDPSITRGPFIAIQSWLPHETWLPAKYRSLVDFYKDLLSWIVDTRSNPTFVQSVKK